MKKIIIFVLMITILFTNFCMTYAASTLTVAATTNYTGNILFDSYKKDAVVTYTNAGSVDLNIMVQYTIKEGNNIIATLGTKPLTVATESSTTDVVSLDIGKYGIFSLNISASLSDGSIVTEIMPFSICAEATADNESLGVNGLAYDPMSELLPIIKKTGFGSVRVDYHWRSIEMTKGNYRVDSKQQAFLENALKNDVDVLMILGYANKLYCDGEFNGTLLTTEEQRAAFAKYIAFLVDYVKDYNVDEFEIWNEPFNATTNRTEEAAETVLATNKIAYQTIKEVYPDATVVGVGPHSMLNQTIYNLTKNLFDGTFGDNAGEYIDALALHPYCDTASSPEQYDIEEKILKYRTLMTDNGYSNIPIYATEFGWDTSTDKSSSTYATEEDQAKYLVRYFVINKASGPNDRFWLYCMENRRTGDDGVWTASEKEDNFGLVHNKYTEHPFMAKPALLSCAFMNKTLAGATAGEILTAPKHATFGGEYAYKFSVPQKDVYILWSTMAFGSTDINTSIPSEAVYYDMYGNVLSDIPTSLTDSPIYAIVDNSLNRDTIRIDYKDGAVIIEGITSSLNSGDYVNLLVTKPGVNKINEEAYSTSPYLASTKVSDDGIFRFKFMLDTNLDYTGYVKRDGQEIAQIKFAGYGDIQAILSMTKGGVDVDAYADISDDDILNVEARISSHVADSGATLIVAEYDRNNALCKCLTTSDINDGLMSVNYSVTDVVAGGRIKVMLWDNLKNITPIVEALVIE